jgi:hypothetical protein
LCLSVLSKKKNKKCHTVRRVPKSIEKYHTVRRFPKSIEKYHTVRRVPKSNRKTKNTTLSEEFQNLTEKQKILHCQKSSKI